MAGAGLKVAVLYRPGRNVQWQRRFTGADIPDDAIEEAELQRDALREAGYEAHLVPWDAHDPLRTAAGLRELGAGLVFNASSLAEVALLEAMGIPYCGSDLNLVALDKADRKKLWCFHGIPTAPFVVVDHDRVARGSSLPLSAIGPGWTPAPPLCYPMFVKPVRGRGSAGISDDSIVENAGSLRRQAEAITSRLGQAALVESYIQGREVTVGVVGDPPRALVPLEIEYNRARTNSFAHKQGHEILHCPARLSPERLAAVQDLALQAFVAVRARDYGRVDTIVDDQGRVTVLEINTFAGLKLLPGEESSPHDSYVGTMARAMGMKSAGLLNCIVESARRRYAI